MAPRKPPCKWTDDHLETMLDSLYTQKAGFGQGGNPQNSHFQAACDAVNDEYGASQNQPKTLRSIFAGLRAWDSRSGLSYDDAEYGCGVDDSTQDQWMKHLAEHKAIAPYRNTPWKWYAQMKTICTAVPVKGQRVFSASMQSQPAAPQDDAEDEEAEPLSGEKDTEDTQTQVSTQNVCDKTPVEYSDDEDVLVSASQKVAGTPGLLKMKRQASDEQPEPGSQRKKSRPSGVQALIDANKRMDRVGDILENAFSVLGSAASGVAAPKTPTRHGDSVADSSPMRARKAAASAATLEMQHLGDVVKVTKFLRYLEENPASVITYNTLVAPELAELRQAYVKQCLQEYEEKEERRALGM
ncbi:hypothetical protein ACG7TL_007927 [Trametes sanguinea]